MKAHEAVFLAYRVEEDRPSKLRIVTSGAYKAMARDWDYSFGAVRHTWKEMPEEKIMECVLWTGFDIAESYGVPLGEVTKELEKIEGFTEYWNTLGRRIGALF